MGDEDEVGLVKPISDLHPAVLFYTVRHWLLVHIARLDFCSSCAGYFDSHFMVTFDIDGEKFQRCHLCDAWATGESRR